MSIEAPTFDDIIPQVEDKKDSQIEELQNRLASEKDARLEERFVWIILLCGLLDVVFFTIIPSWSGPLCLLLLELLVFIPLAKRMGVEEIAVILTNVMDGVAKRARDGK
jgi:hypothetical protein